MNQFKLLFNSVRKPGHEIDTLECSFKSISDGTKGPTNVAIACRGYIHTFDLVHEDQETLLTPAEIEHQLSSIENWCSAQRCDGPGIVALSLGDRATWARNRTQLENISPENLDNLKSLDSCLFFVTFDDALPDTDDEVNALITSFRFQSRSEYKLYI